MGKKTFFGPDGDDVFESADPPVPAWISSCPLMMATWILLLVLYRTGSGKLRSSAAMYLPKQMSSSGTSSWVLLAFWNDKSVRGLLRDNSSPKTSHSFCKESGVSVSWKSEGWKQLVNEHRTHRNWRNNFVLKSQDWWQNNGESTRLWDYCKLID